ncbi:unnamed protein product [Hymenolepis diminuta]|uniref:GCM domain-containing protein n=1 Tax=Hymenolepis diminuta TaxID=6216 RepID=A0A564Y6R3_HYMDI|nr:unnamed protein product [Hymenolepis diminuta]
MVIDSEDEPAALIIDESFQDNNNENNQPDESRIESEGVESSRQKGVLHQSQFDSKTEPYSPPISKIKSFDTDESSRENRKIPKVPSGTKTKRPISTFEPEKSLKKRRKGEKGEEINSYDPPPGSTWDIEDKFLPEPLRYDKIQEWIDGDTKKIFQEYNIHICDISGGWVVRDVSSENPLLMKKVCMGVLVCSTSCNFTDDSVGYRPAATEKTFKDQIGRCCPNPRCNGNLIHVPCEGYNGTPVIHLWRFYNKRLYFQSMGRHNHARPQISVPSAKVKPIQPKFLRPTTLAIPSIPPPLQLTAPINLVPAHFPTVQSLGDLNFSVNGQFPSESIFVEVPINLSNKPTYLSQVLAVSEEQLEREKFGERSKEGATNSFEDISNHESDIHSEPLFIESASKQQSDDSRSAPDELPLHPFMIDAVLAVPYKSKLSEKSHLDVLWERERFRSRISS